MKIIIKENVEDYILGLYEDVISEFESDVSSQIMNYKDGDTIDWRVVPSGRLIKIWQDYSKLGFIRDTKGLNEIKSILEENILKLEYTNAMLGHDTYRPQDEWDSLFELSEEEMTHVEYVISETDFVTYKGQDLISDYGLPQLRKILYELISEKKPEKQLVIMDRILNVIHPRNDLSLFFIEGGKHTLNRLFLENKQNSIYSYIIKERYHEN